MRHMIRPFLSDELVLTREDLQRIESGETLQAGGLTIKLEDAGASNRLLPVEDRA